MESKILIATSYGNSEVLSFHTQSLPILTEGMVRIRVQSAGINPIDARRMTGEFRHGSLPQTFGTEFSGEIIEINNKTSSWKVGDQVLGSGGAFTHATIIDVPEGNLVKRPENIAKNLAGSIAGVAQTAMTILNEMGPAKSLLIHGGSGGVGSITIQLAVEKGIQVVATASEKNQEYLRSLGAQPVIYGNGLEARIKALHPEPFDVAIDMVGTLEATEVSLALVKEKGFIGSISGKQITSNRITPIWVKRNVDNLRYVTIGIASGKFKWEIDKSYPFNQASEAFDEVLKGHTRGKLVLTFEEL